MALNRLGVANLGSPATIDGERDLFQRKYLTEVLAAYDEMNVMDNLHRTRRITNGKSASFPAVWKINAEYHVPGGGSLAGTNEPALNEVIVKVDRQLVAHTKVAEIDELMNYWDVRQQFASEQGAALARQSDKNKLQLAVLASRASSHVSGAPTGGSVTIDTDADGDTLVQAIYDAIVKLEENDVPVNPSTVAVVLRPTQYYEIVTDSSRAIHQDFGGQGSIAQGIVGPIGDVRIVKSNNLPNTDLSAKVSGGGNVADNLFENTNNDYWGDFTNTRGVVMHRDAISTVKLQNLIFESEYLLDELSTLMVTRQAEGSNVTRPDAAVEITL